jgi:poly(3-hydroxyalkanoate) synthetase
VFEVDGAFDAFRFSITINGLTALACVERATGEREVTAIGYCGGGKQLAAALLAYSLHGCRR